MEEVITGDNIGRVHKRAGFFFFLNSQLCILDGVASNYSVLNIPSWFLMTSVILKAV